MAELKLAEALDPVYVSDLERLSLAQLRAKRDACAELETELSYLRRLVQARLDLVVAGAQRRHLGLPALGAETLVEQLPQILGDHSRAVGPSRLTSILAPAEDVQASVAARVEEVLPSERLGSLGSLGATELDVLLVSLSNLERAVSAERRALHDIQDRFQEELVRRYRSGEATVDALLH